MLALIIAVTSVAVPLTLLSFATGTLMPLLTGLVTHVNASSPFKAGANLVLTVIGGVLAAFVAHQGTLDLGQIAEAVFTAYLASGVTYHTLWKPTGIAPAVNAQGLALGAPSPPDVVPGDKP